MSVKEKSTTQDESSSDSSDSDDSSDISLPTPPDGGWGWVVVAASFMVHLIADGCAFSFGVLYAELLEEFKEPKGKTAWVGSLFVSVPLITGPIASALTNKYGCRVITIIGSVIAGIGCIVSSFATSIDHLCFTFGIIAGFGLSMVYVPAVVIVAYYFEKRRAFATGVAVAGSGIGTFIMAPLTEWLIKLYNWDGAVLIIGGIMLNMVVCGAVFRPLVNPKTKDKKNSSKQASGELQNSKSSPSNGKYELKNGTAPELYSLLEEGSDQTYKDEPMVHSLVQFPTYLQKDLPFISADLLKDMEKGGHKNFQEMLRDPDFYNKYCVTKSLTDMSQISAETQKTIDDTQNETIPNGTPSTPTVADNTPHQKQNGAVHQPGPSSSMCNNSKFNTSNGHPVWYKNSRHHHHHYLDSMNRARHNPNTGEAWQMQRQDIFYRGSLEKPGLLNQPNKRSASCPNIPMHSHHNQEDDSEGRCNPLTLLQFSREAKHVLKEMMDMTLLRSVIFVYFCISSMVLYMWYDVPYVYTPDKAIEMGTQVGKASLLVAIIGITSTVGQVVVGYIGDHPKVDALLFYNALTSIAGAATMLVPLLKSYLGLAIYSGSYGFFISGNYALTTIILVELLGMEKLTNAYGLVMLAEGLANLVGPPFAGWISDVTGTYNHTFFIAGVGMLISGVMLFAIPWLRKCDTLSLNARENDSSSSSNGSSSASQDESMSATQEKLPRPASHVSARSESLPNMVSEVETVV